VSHAASEDDVIQSELTTGLILLLLTISINIGLFVSPARRQSSSLEFQVVTPTGFRALTGRGVRATQLILSPLLDYDTLLISAYLRQGRADELMLKRPTEQRNSGGVAESI